MPLAAAVEVNREGQVRRRLVVVDVFRQQDGIRAQVHEFFARHDAGDNLRHLLVDERLATRDGDHRGSALVDGAQSVLDTHPLLQNLLRVIDLAATGAGQVALEERLQHQDQRITLHTAQLAAGDVAPNTICLDQRNTQTLNSLLQSQHGCAVVPPDPCPLQLEPRRKLAGGGACQLSLQRFGLHPAPRENLIRIGLHRVAAAADEHRAQLLLRAGRLELRLVLELEQKLQRTAQTQLLVEPPLNGGLHALRPARVAAATIRPVQRPEALRGGALLQQQLALAVEYQQGERPVQHALPVVALRLAQVADFAVGLVNQNERFRIERGHLIHHAGNSVPAHGGASSQAVL